MNEMIKPLSKLLNRSDRSIKNPSPCAEIKQLNKENITVNSRGMNGNPNYNIALDKVNNNNAQGAPSIRINELNNICAEDDDDDCVIVEHTPTYVTTIDDDDDDDDDDHNDDYEDDDADGASAANATNNDDAIQSGAIPTTSSANRSYQSFAETFLSCHASTPCNRNLQPDLRYNPACAQDTFAKDNFFLNFVSNSTLARPAYTPIAPLVEENQQARTIAAADNNSAVVLDDTSLNASNLNNTTLKPQTAHDSSTSSEDDDDDSSEYESEEGELEDDSVIFVSETNTNDFIPITNVEDINKNRRKLSANGPPSKVAHNFQHYNNLLNKNEKRQLQEYNSNTYNPNAGKALTSKKRMVIIDGSNVAFKHSSDQLFSVKGITIAIEYFQKLGHEVKAVIPQYRMNQHKSTDPIELMRLHKAGFIVQTPCKNLPGLTSTSYDDRFILQLASELDAAIVSNDNYRDLMHENAAFKKIIETRVIGYTWCNDLFLLPKDPYGKWGPTLDMILNRS